MAPLLQKPVPGCSRGQFEYIITHTPFSPSDLVIWKKDAPSFQSDPQTVIKTLNSIIESYNPSWGDMTQLLHIFLTKDEFMKLFEKTEEIAKKPVIITPGQVATTRVAWLLNCPDWDYNIPNHWDKYSRAKENLIEALGEVGPLNWPEFQCTMQRENETPDAFWVCLLEVGFALVYLDANNPKVQRILASAFVDQSASDIQDYFHKIMSNWSSLEISELRRIANFMFDQRDRLREEEKERKAEREREKERRRSERKEDLKMFAAININRKISKQFMCPFLACLFPVHATSQKASRWM